MGNVQRIFGSWYLTHPVEAFDLIGYACRKTGHESILYWICIQPYVPIHQCDSLLYRLIRHRTEFRK